MLTAVEFHDDQCFYTCKVADVEPDLMLSPEFEARDLTAT